LEPFEDLGVPLRKAGFRGCIIGPDVSGEKELLYFNFSQGGGNLFLVAVDPDSGSSKQYDADVGPGAHGLILGPDKRIYLGTWGEGLVLRFDPGHPEMGIRVLGRPAESETYIWMYTIGGDGKIYGGTYGNAKLISCCPETDELRDLGRMDPTQMYTRSVATGKDGRIYVGVGIGDGDVVVYDPWKGTHGSIVPDELKGQFKQGRVTSGRDGHAYAQIGSAWYRCESGELQSVGSPAAPPEIRLSSGEVVETTGNGFYSIRYPDGRTEHRTFEYRGSGVAIFHVAEGPFGRIYGSSAMPLELFEYDPETDGTRHLGNPTDVNGEIYSMATLHGLLYVCAYPGSWLSVYDPRKPWDYGTSAGSNPRGIGYAGEGHLRPRAMIVGPDERLYIGSLPPYGEHGGALGVYDPEEDEFIENYRNLVPNQGVMSLAYEPESALIFGGTNISGGGGTVPIEHEAHLWAWDIEDREKVTDIIPIPGDACIGALLGHDGMVFGYSRPSGSIFRFEVDSEKVDVLHRVEEGVPDLSMGIMEGMIYGLSHEYVFRLDPGSGHYRILDRYHRGIDAGFAMNKTGIYFGSGAHLVRYPLDRHL